MKVLKRYKYHLIAVLVLMTLLLMGAKTRRGQVTKSANDLPKVSTGYQMNHALELFTEDQASLALVSAGAGDMRGFILTVVKRSLSESDQGRAFEIARAVIKESNHLHMDPLFLLAVIATESQFNIGARGTHGEIGLMQILPKTAKWMAQQAGLPENFNLEDPSVNIRIGATYFSHLRHSFKTKCKQYIAAYNMGSANVRRLMASNTEPELYPARVLNNYVQIYSALDMTREVIATRGLASAR